MINNLKRTVSLLIAVLLVFSLAACGENNSGNTDSTEAQINTEANTSIVGKWNYKLDFKTVMESSKDEAYKDQEALYESMLKAFSGITIDLFFEFDENNSFKFYADEESAKKAVEQMKEKLIDVLPDMFEAMGVSKEDYAKYLESSGMTEEELAASYAQNMNTDSITKMSTKGTYKAEDGKLCLATDDDKIDESAYITYEVSGDKLTFKDYTGDVKILGNFKDKAFPMVMERTK